VPAKVTTPAAKASKTKEAEVFPASAGKQEEEAPEASPSVPKEVSSKGFIVNSFVDNSISIRQWQH
jgi:hypothetical protein